MFGSAGSVGDMYELPALKAGEFAAISEFIRGRYGIDLRQGKEQLVASRLARKVRDGRFRSFREYFDRVMRDPDGPEMTEMVDALTTNHTSFFRESSHFAFLREVAPSFRTSRLRIWSAACSSGEEPYSIACSLVYPPIRGVGDFEILATDVSTRVLGRAREAVYPVASLAGAAPDLVQTCFRKGRTTPAGMIEVRPELASRVEFRRLNLIERLPQFPPFQVIFCRNVMIYFDKTTQSAVVSALAARLEPGGYLFVGHSESLAGVQHGLEYVRPAVYRVPGARATRTK